MPTLPLSPLSSIHSWSFVYFRFAGYEAISCSRRVQTAPLLPGSKGPGLLRSLIERQRHDARARAAAADVDVELGAGRRVLDRQVCHADRFLQVRRLRAAGDDAGLLVADEGVVAMARDAAVDHLEADDLALRTFGFLCPQRGSADEVVLLPADDPAQIRFHRSRRLVDVVAVEAHARFEPQRVARAEAAWNQ